MPRATVSPSAASAKTTGPTVVAINPSTNAVETRVSTQGVNYGIAGAERAVWVTQPNTDGIEATPPQPGTVTRIDF